MPTIHLEQVAKLYKGSGRHTAAVLNIELTIEQGEFVFLVGSRGAGKSTLLDLISGELMPDRGRILLGNADLRTLVRRKSKKLRHYVGRVPQESALIQNQTVFKNLTAHNTVGPLKGILVDEPLVRKALGLVGMPDSQERYPAELSFSECRRVEVAKAILYSPSVLLLDEITERVDDGTIWDILQLLSEMNRHGTTIVMATNAKRFINIMRKRVITLSDGKIIGDVRKGRYGMIR